MEKSKFKLTFSIFTLLLLINFTFISCEENKIPTEDDTAQHNDGVTLVKADLSELIDKIGDKNTKLVALLKENPVSKLKKSNLEKSKTFEFLFDTNNIMALKINKDHVIYIIPAYKSNNERDNNLYSISININGNTIDTKLTTVEINNDGTLTNNTRNFNFSNLTSKNQTYAGYVDMELKCDCVASISDCTCHTSHASGGCDHPDISMTCTNCSGGSGISIINPSTTSNNNSPTSNNQIVTVSNSSSNYGYTYNLLGNEIYFALMKIYKPDYVFSSLQKYNIINTPEITNSLLQFLDIDGSSKMNKDFALSIIDAIEEGTVTTYKEFNVLLNAYKTTKEFVEFKNQFFIDNPTTTEAQFLNRFMGTSEGSDANYDATFWDNPNLTFPQQSLPTFADFSVAFPKKSDPLYDTAEKMFNSIGGNVLSFYNGPETNTCAIRLSKALNYSGVTIPNLPEKTYLGADGKYYFKAAYELNLWMRKTFGTNPASTSNPITPLNQNHFQYNQAQAGVHGINLSNLLIGKKGIYSIYSSNFKWASGHADLLYDNATCGNACHFYDAPIYRLDIWILN